MSKSNLKPECINDLLSERFIVPAYQRGYRWTKKEVVDLLDDILQFYKKSQNANSEVFYCLQPLVVTRKDDAWIVIDGQQRLTTIKLILTFLEPGMKFLEKGLYGLSYESRPESERYLNELNDAERLKYIDFYHMHNAFSYIKSWFGNLDGSVRNAVLNTLVNDDSLGKNVKFIWYEIEGTDAVDIFTRINMGKIPLTNAELIKALFLKKENFGKNHPDHIQLKQLQIATEWDRIESKLQNDSFWYFINDNKIEYDTRIEFIFDLIAGKEPNNYDYHTFIDFNKRLKVIENREDEWLDIKKYFMTMEEWFTNRTTFHLIGYLVSTGAKISTLITLSIGKSKKDFINELRKKIKANFKNVELDDIKYNDRRIKNILLLFNIESILQNRKSNMRFQFDEFKKEKWDIEHISSVMSEIPSLTKSRAWLENLNDYFTGSSVLDYHENSKNGVGKLIVDIRKLLDEENYDLADFREVYDTTLVYFKEDQTNQNDEDFTHSLGNLTLLDTYTNRSYKNAIFPVKRKRILLCDKDGVFVPICTKNVFLKYYSNQLSEVLFWQKSDAEAYLSEIKNTLSQYLT